LAVSGFAAGACPHAGHAKARAASRIILFIAVLFCFSPTPQE
jgi:hypothetical protein